MMMKQNYLSRAGLLAGWLLGALAAPADSIWNSETSRNPVADKKANRIGDIVMVTVDEDSATYRNFKTKTEKASSADASLSSFLYGTSTGGSDALRHNGKYPAMKFSGQNAFEGKGEINNTDRIDTKFGARVVDVMPNNTMIIEGVRRVSHTKETQTIILRATVRLEDIEADNSVISYKLADVSLRYINTGVASDTQNKGWFTRIWDKVSPF
ncbi:MAG: flagellar basal body L-ring protein FlgH [Verrucomicrobiota bacterium]|nr:flagellar basal body L-ring protein FlgH [Verrucomicrobiota bacterium]